ncbi:hypothetical protein niasHT_020776 [Heterodera trifolii]|uniref:Uncharacterized protein n=1 Tax=Heterodera trifolii TaxID=157864 RepID=A0ABD2KF80_9BILA
MDSFLLFILLLCSVLKFGKCQQFLGQPNPQNYQLPYPNLQYASPNWNNANFNENMHQQNARGSTDSVSIRLIDEILEIFVPPNTYAPKRTPSQPPLIPYGLNQFLPATSKSHDEATAEETPVNFVGSERRFQPPKSHFSYEKVPTDQPPPPWANLAREMFGLFKPLETTTETPSTTTMEASILDRFMPKIPNIFNSFVGGRTTMATTTAATPPTLFPFLSFFTEKPTTTKAAPMPWLSFLRQEQQPKRVDTRANPILEPLSQFFGVEKKAVEEGRAQIDTGGPNNFDRFVVREKMAPDNPFLGFVGGGKFNERGIKWEDGNIRLVNKNGNTLLGSETGVNDRSVDIPLMRWLDMANNFASSYHAQQEDRIRRW